MWGISPCEWSLVFSGKINLLAGHGRCKSWSSKWSLVAPSSSVHVMDCRLYGANPLSEPMMTYQQSNPYGDTTGLRGNMDTHFVLMVRGTCWSVVGLPSRIMRIFEVKEITTHHQSDVIMSTMASLITGILMVCSSVCSGADQRKH